MTMDSLRHHYEKYPYPRISLLAKVRRKDSYLMNYQASVYAAFGSIENAVEHPKILVAGAGTFEPCVVALANPDATIIAIDISKRSLSRLRWHLLRHGVLNRVQLIHGDFMNPPVDLGSFDMIVGTGLLHHLPNPAHGLFCLEQMLATNGIMRLMLYSKHGREQIYQVQRLAQLLKIKTPKKLKKFMKSLPADHPMKLHFFLYGDSSTKHGIADGFLNARDQAFDAIECRALLDSAGLKAYEFLHPVGGKPMDLHELLGDESELAPSIDTMDEWEKVAVLDRLTELESNFHFIAARKADFKLDVQSTLKEKLIVLNPVIARSLPYRIFRWFNRSVQSRLLRKKYPLSPLQNKKLRFGISVATAEELLGKENLKEYLDALILLEK